MLAVLWACCCAAAALLGTAAAEPAGCELLAPVPPGVSYKLQHIEHDGVMRDYLLYLPRSYRERPRRRYPVVFAFHGWSNDAYDVLDSGDLIPTAEAAGFVLVAPQGLGDNPNIPVQDTWRSWNTVGTTESPGVYGPTCTPDADPNHTYCYTSCRARGRGCDQRGCDWTTCHDDFGFVAALLTKLELQLCVDPLAVFATGFSNGAMLAYSLGLRMAGRFAAVAPVAGGVQLGFLGLADGGAVAVMDFHGTSDDTIPFNATTPPLRHGLPAVATSECHAARAPAGLCTRALSVRYLHAVRRARVRA